MAMELHVLSDRRLGSIAEWQRAIDAEGFPLRLAADVDLAQANGFLPARLRSKQTGFECFHDRADETMDFLGRINFDHPWKFALGFRWIGDPAELEAVWMAAAAYAVATGGIIFDPQETEVFTPVRARETVRQIERDVIKIEAMRAEIVRRFSDPSGR